VEVKWAAWWAAKSEKPAARGGTWEEERGVSSLYPIADDGVKCEGLLGCCEGLLGCESLQELVGRRCSWCAA